MLKKIHKILDNIDSLNQKTSELEMGHVVDFLIDLGMGKQAKNTHVLETTKVPDLFDISTYVKTTLNLRITKNDWLAYLKFESLVPNESYKADFRLKSIELYKNEINPNVDYEGKGQLDRMTHYLTSYTLDDFESDVQSLTKNIEYLVMDLEFKLEQLNLPNNQKIINVSFAKELLDNVRSTF